MKRQTVISLIVLIGLLVSACIWFGQNHGLLPTAAGEEAVLYDQLFSAVVAIAFGLFLVVQGVLIYVLLRFRRRQGEEGDGAPWHENIRLEMIWTAIPTVIVLWVALYSFDVYSAMRGSEALMMAHHHLPTQHKSVLVAQTEGEMPAVPSDTLNIDVQAMQFAWIFNYPNGVTSGELHVPLGKHIHLSFTALDVIHAFWVPQLRLKQDTIPGTPTYLDFVPRQIGEYPVVCAELCGSYHGGMRTTMVVEAEADYEKWLQEQVEVAQQKTPQVATASMSEAEYLVGKLHHHH
ncbi:MAG: cytochrome c oxidase subunit II [Pseudanabaenaceae cyanobacterium]